MAKIEVKIPDIGEIDSAEVIEICVATGDVVQQDDALIVLESDKASMEVPAPCDGKISQVAVKIGDQVEEGVLILTIEGDDAGTKSGGASTGGDGTSAEATAKAEPAPPAYDPPPATSQPQSPASTATTTAATTTATGVYAGPSVRRLARELGVDLSQVKATGAHGRTLKEDVQQYVQGRLGQDAGTSGIPEIPEQDYAKFGPVDIKPVGRIRRRGAEQLHASWLNLPQVTNHDEADITGLDVFRRKQNAANADMPKLTPLPFILKACAATLLQNPQLNGSFTEGGNKFVYKQYVHIGMAVDTPDGLVVPVIRDVDQKSIRTLAEEAGALAAKSRSGKLSPKDIQGASFTVSSLGALGGTGFTPIVNAPQVAILGVAKSIAKPVYLDSGELAKRLVIPISLSYDHRAVNGADAGRFMVKLKAYLEDIRSLLL